MATCTNCNRKLGMLNFKYTSSDGDTFCRQCIEKAGYGVNASFLDIKKISTSEIKARADKTIYRVDDIAMFDDTNRIAYISSSPNPLVTKLDLKISYSDIADFQVVQNSQIIVRSGLGAAVAGGVLFGPAGAITGAILGKGKQGPEMSNYLGIVLFLKNGEKVNMIFLNKQVKTDSTEYSSASSKLLQVAGKLERSLKLVK